MSEQLIEIPANPPPPPISQFKVSRNLKVRGDAIYIIFGGVLFSVLVFLMLLNTSIFLALLLAGVPTAGAVMFYFRFVRNKPKYYFDYWCNGLVDKVLHKKHMKKNAGRYIWLERR